MQKTKVHYTRYQVDCWLRKTFPDIDWDEVKAELPPIIWRSRWDTLADRCGLPYTRKYIQNLDCEGRGPGSIQQSKGGDTK
ncbi:hypothetical protein Dthio_PD3644 [Desulfonatronospira thiodismutans ASO3-1]|uniref:Uncharacterized protein n=1 Tax=Desulfonatronospira thiodismutans ASO3-1 TaxID=555779 RepID=D6SJY5_9BACT|nr:hypothetical protein [Desulfonatronospira thiodismutans]EFI36188.1 hypothetical protein Dthio_PD3644 [Desulfonatronospira thiodismutans ASO3-1]